jgi:hypothetical protein
MPSRGSSLFNGALIEPEFKPLLEHKYYLVTQSSGYPIINFKNYEGLDFVSLNNYNFYNYFSAAQELKDLGKLMNLNIECYVNQASKTAIIIESQLIDARFSMDGLFSNIHKKALVSAIIPDHQVIYLLVLPTKYKQVTHSAERQLSLQGISIVWIDHIDYKETLIDKIVTSGYVVNKSKL